MVVGWGSWGYSSVGATGVAPTNVAGRKREYEGGWEEEISVGATGVAPTKVAPRKRENERV
ncbi:hypothetical protein [Salipaludibacillus sp. CF4.18]|uniref:hypothetical protein n=1 Tax=Salipaludibacillus sp. CF4.18 TaxID=3373081 RepID=UPI003EE7296F